MRLSLKDLAKYYHSGNGRGLVSVCSSHPIVLRATIRHGLKKKQTVLIESTCNQVNQHGGYTGKTPTSFVNLVKKIASEEGLPTNQLILGGDHLGPNPWKFLRQDQAMLEASNLVKNYISAGYNKIHLDTSMGCKGEPEALTDEISALRTIKLLKIAEETAKKNNFKLPYYIIGTEVPAPGGANHLLNEITPTTPMAAKKTIDTHVSLIKNEGLGEIIPRIIGLVVQPGVEFGNQNIIRYDRKKVTTLCNVLKDYPNWIFEAHSTDFQSKHKLAELVKDGFSILKVGPELTFSLREGLYALDLIAGELSHSYGNRPLYKTMEQLMVATPSHWENYYFGNNTEKCFQRHYSLSDRIRYYWDQEAAKNATKHLFETLKDKKIPSTLINQFLPSAKKFADKSLNPRDLIISKITENLKSFTEVC